MKIPYIFLILPFFEIFRGALPLAPPHGAAPGSHHGTQALLAHITSFVGAHH